MDSIDVLTLLSMGDFFVEVKKLSMKATEGLYQTLSLSAKAIEISTKEDTLRPGGEVKLSSGQALENVDVAEACGGHANLKPRFTDAPWKMPLLTQATTQTSLAKCTKVPESCSACVDEMRETASTIKTEMPAVLNATRKRLHQMASDFVGCNTLTTEVSTCRSTFRAEVKSHISCRKQRHAENDVSMACEMF